MAGGQRGPADARRVHIHPERGVFNFVTAPPVGAIVTTYHFGFMSDIGAGGYPAKLLEPITQPTHLTQGDRRWPPWRDAQRGSPPTDRGDR